jgi:hypothetical protein
MGRKEDFVTCSVASRMKPGVSEESQAGTYRTVARKGPSFEAPPD